MSAKTFYSIIVSLDGDKDVSKGLQGIAVQAGLASAALGAITFKAAEAAREYDAALNKFNTIANETTGTINEQKKAFRELTAALKNGVTETEALNAGYEVLSSGYQNLADVTGILEVSQKAAVGGFSDLKTVADAVTTVLNVYGDSYGEAATVTEKANDILSQAITVQNLGKITVDEYAQSIGILAPTAKAANVSLAEMNAAIALSTSRGIAATTSIRGFRQLLVNLIRPTDAAARAAEANGIAIGSQALATEGYGKVLERIVEVAKNNPNIVSQIFTDVDSLNIANVLISNADALNRFAREAEVAAQKGILEAQFELVSESDAEKQKRLLNLINEAFVDLGTGVVNTLEPLIEAVSAALKAFKDAPDSLKQFTGGLSLILISAGGLTTSLIAGRASLLAFNEALKAIGVSSTSIAASLGVFAAASIVASETVNTFQAINNAASTTEAGVRALEEQYQRFLDAQSQSGGAEEQFNATAFAIERTKEAIEDSISPLGKLSDNAIVFLRDIIKGINNLIDSVPLVPQVFKDAAKQLIPFGLGDFVDEGKLVTRAEAAANKIKIELDNALAKSAEKRNALALIDFQTADLESLREGLATLTAAKDALNKTRFTNPEDVAEIEREKKLLDQQIASLSKIAEARGLSTKSSITTTAAVEEQADAEKRLNDELKKSISLLEAKANTELKEIDILKAKGQISDVEAIERSAAIEAKLNADKRAEMEKLLQDQSLQGEARVKLEAEIAKLILDTEASAADRIIQINKAKLDAIASERERDIARIEASGKSELEIARQVAQIKIDSAKKESEEINRQLADTKAGSSQRIELETRLFKLQASVAKERADLAKKEIAAIDEQIKQKLTLVEAEEKIAKARAGNNKVINFEAELQATEKRLQVLREIASIEGLAEGTKLRLQVDIAEAEAKRLDLNERITKEVTDRQVEALKGQLSLQEQLIRFEQERISATRDFISAQNSLISTISSGLGAVVSPIQALKDAYDKAGSASQRLADLDRARADALRDRALRDIPVPDGASEALKAQIAAQNRIRAQQRERLAQQREQQNYERQRAELLKAEAKEREELVKKQREAAIAERQRSILLAELAKLGIQINSSGDVANDIKQAQIQLQLLELENQRQLNDLKVEQQMLEVKNLQLQQQAIIAEENLRIQSGVLNEQELAAARLRLQLAQNQLDNIKQQQANLQRVAELENRNLALRQRLTQSQLSSQSATKSNQDAALERLAQSQRGIQSALNSSQSIALDKTSEVAISKPITDAISRLGTADQVTSAIARLETISGNILSATQQLPSQLARVIPKPVVPR